MNEQAESPSPSPSSSSSLISLGDIYHILFRRKYVILSCVALGLLVAAVIYVTTPVQYESEARLLVRYVTESTDMDPSAKGERVLSPDQRGENIMNSEIEILTSADLIAKTIDETDLRTLVRPPESASAVARYVARLLGRLGIRTGAQAKPIDRRVAAEMITGNLRIETPRHSSVIMVAFGGPNPAAAQDVLSRLIELYLRKHLEVHRSVATHEFLAQQADQARTRLGDTEKEMAELMATANIESLEESKKELSTREADLQRSIWEAEADLAASMARVEFLRKALGGESSTVSTAEQPLSATVSEDIARLQLRLQRLRTSEAQLLATYTEESLPVVQVRERIADLERMLADAGGLGNAPAGIDPSLLKSLDDLKKRDFDEQTAIESTKQRLWAMRNQQEEVREHRAKVASVEGRLLQLQRRKELDESNYLRFSESIEQARINDALDGSRIPNISIVQAPTYPVEALYPTRGAGMAWAVVISLLVGIGMATVIEKLFVRSYSRQTEFESAVADTLLISVPFLQSDRVAPGSPPSTDVLLVPSPAATADTTADRGRIEAPGWAIKSQFAKYHEALMDRLLMTAGGGAPTSFLVGVTACRSNAGATTTACGLALSLARHGDGRVLFVDATDLATILDENANHAAIAACLVEPAGNGADRTPAPQPGLFVLSPSSNDIGAAAVFGGGLARFLQGARESGFDFVLFDLPPVTNSGRILRILSALDGVILVVEAEKDRRDTVQKTIEMLQETKARLAGLVLNKTRSYIPSWIHAE